MCPPCASTTWRASASRRLVSPDIAEDELEQRAQELLLSAVTKRLSSRETVVLASDTLLASERAIAVVEEQDAHRKRRFCQRLRRCRSRC